MNSGDKSGFEVLVYPSMRVPVDLLTKEVPLSVALS